MNSAAWTILVGSLFLLCVAAVVVWCQAWLLRDTRRELRVARAELRERRRQIEAYRNASDEFFERLLDTEEI